MLHSELGTAMSYPWESPAASGMKQMKAYMEGRRLRKENGVGSISMHWPRVLARNCELSDFG